MRRLTCFVCGLALFLGTGSAIAKQHSSAAPSRSAASEPAKPTVDADGTYHVGNGVEVPKLVHSVDAEFSELARHRKIQGTVVLSLTVMADGRVANLHVERSAAEDFIKLNDRKAAASLDEKAMDAVQQYRFEPGTYEGKPVPVAITIVVGFHMSSAPN